MLYFPNQYTTYTYDPYFTPISYQFDNQFNIQYGAAYPHNILTKSMPELEQQLTPHIIKIYDIIQPYLTTNFSTVETTLCKILEKNINKYIGSQLISGLILKNLQPSIHNLLIDILNKNIIY